LWNVCKNCKERASAPHSIRAQNSEWKYRAYCSEIQQNLVKSCG
jgi:hypothetical protein